MKPPPNLEKTQRPRSSPLTATQWENEWWRCHSFKPWMGSAWAAECVCHFKPWNERFFPVIIVSLIAPMASLTQPGPSSRFSGPGSKIDSWLTTHLRPGVETTPCVRASQSEARDLGTEPMRSVDRLPGGYCQGLLKHESCQWVNQGNHFYYHLVYLATSTGWDKKVTEGLDSTLAEQKMFKCLVGFNLILSQV